MWGDKGSNNILSQHRQPSFVFPQEAHTLTHTHNYSQKHGDPICPRSLNQLITLWQCCSEGLYQALTYISASAGIKQYTSPDIHNTLPLKCPSEGILPVCVCRDPLQARPRKILKTRRRVFPFQDLATAQTGRRHATLQQALHMPIYILSVHEAKARLISA